jgi:NADH-quinone oxidoreductase subunit J
MQHNILPLFYVFVFYLFAIIAVASALAFVTRKSPVAAALWLVNVMFSLAAMYVLLDAQFIGIIQILVYAGAIMVVVLFVIMLLNLGHPSELSDARGTGWKMAAGLVGVALLAMIAAMVRAKAPESLRLPPNFTAEQIASVGAITPVAGPLFHEYLLAFEVTSVLLLSAIIGAVALARRREAAADAR